jgi:hypothetical protein
MLGEGRRLFDKVQVVAPSRPNRVGCLIGQAANERLFPLVDLVGMDLDLLANTEDIFNFLAASIAPLALNAELGLLRFAFITR